MNNLANALFYQGRSAEAERLYRLTLDAQKRVLGEDHPNTLLSIDNLASALSTQGRYAEAEKLFRLTLDVRKRVMGEDHPDTVVIMNNLVSVLEQQGKKEEAEALRMRVAEIRGCLKEKESGGKPDVRPDSSGSPAVMSPTLPS